MRGNFPELPAYPPLRPDTLKFPGGYAFGGPGRRGMMAMAKTAQSVDAAAPASAPVAEGDLAANTAPGRQNAEVRLKEEGKARADAAAPVAIRADFSETAFWKPQLLTGADGSASIEFTVPDSVTSWNVWVHAVTKDLKAGSVQKETRSVKDLMVRPYVPRFLREGDAADLKVVVNNASEGGLSGRVRLEILDTSTNASALSEFGLSPERATLPFSAAAGAGADVTFRLSTPRRVGPTRSRRRRSPATCRTASGGRCRCCPAACSSRSRASPRSAAASAGR